MRHKGCRSLREHEQRRDSPSVRTRSGSRDGFRSQTSLILVLWQGFRTRWLDHHNVVPGPWAGALWPAHPTNPPRTPSLRLKDSKVKRILSSTAYPQSLGLIQVFKIGEVVQVGKSNIRTIINQDQSKHMARERSSQSPLVQTSTSLYSQPHFKVAFPPRQERTRTRITQLLVPMGTTAVCALCTLKC